MDLAKTNVARFINACWYSKDLVMYELASITIVVAEVEAFDHDLNLDFSSD
jgi:hypothetical protein